VKTQKTNNEKKNLQKANPFPHCGDFEKMAEMMKKCCLGEGDAIDCCSMMMRMMGRSKGAGAKETNETQKQQKGEGNG
jgi:hypothetical protein